MFMPYLRHVNEHVIALSTGAYMTMVEFDGFAFETADVRDTNAHHAGINVLLRNVADERLAVWDLLLRRRSFEYPGGEFSSEFARALDAKYREHMVGQELFANRSIWAIVHAPTAHAVAALKQARKDGVEVDHDALKRLMDTAALVVESMRSIGARQLGCYESDGVAFCEQSGVLHQVLGGLDERTPVVRGSVTGAVYTDRVIVGRETVEVRGAAHTQFAAVLALREYPARTRPTMLADALTLPFELTLAQSFRFYAKAKATEIMTRKQNQMVSAADRASAQAVQLTGAVDELEGNGFVMGEHHLTMAVFAPDMDLLNDCVNMARGALTSGGAVVVREDLGLEAGWFAQLPGNFKYRPRSAPITSLNFAALSSLYGFPKGRAAGNVWGPSIAVLKTSAGGAFHFNLHVEDLGNTLIVGPSGSGKTVVANFTLSQVQKHNPRIVFFDKDRGAELFVRACGGTYLPFQMGQPTGCAPLKALPATPANELFLCHWVEKVVGLVLTTDERNNVAFAVSSVMARPAAERNIRMLRSFINSSPGANGAARVFSGLARWEQGQPLGWVFDCQRDQISIDGRFVGFDMTEFLDDRREEIRKPMMAYLFHRIEEKINGERIVIVIDEFWKALSDPDMSAMVEDQLKTIRKKNGVIMLLTQSPRDAIRSPMAHTIIEQCPTHIYMPNARGDRADYVDGLKLTQREFALIQREMGTNSRRFLIRQGQRSVVAELNLRGFDAELAILSGRTAYIEMMERAIELVGSEPERWVPVFEEERRRAA
jgi:type IV secretion system protein VirB4